MDGPIVYYQNVFLWLITGYEISQDGVNKLVGDFGVILAREKNNAPDLVQKILNEKTLTPEGSMITVVEVQAAGNKNILIDKFYANHFINLFLTYFESATDGED